MSRLDPTDITDDDVAMLREVAAQLIKLKDTMSRMNILLEQADYSRDPTTKRSRH
jgi:phosphopentomutase